MSAFSKADEKKRAKAYSELEADMRDLCRQAEIADLLFEHHLADEEKGDGELGAMAVKHLAAMLRRFKEKYYEVEFGI